MDGDNVTVLHPQVVSNDAVDASRAIIEIIVGEYDENGVLSLLALDQHGVATEQLERLHSVVREGDDGVVVVDGIGHNERVRLLLLLEDGGRGLVIIPVVGT